MIPSNDPPALGDPGTVLREQIAAAERRWRLEWLAWALGRLGLGLAVGFTVWSLLALAQPTMARGWPGA